MVEFLHFCIFGNPKEESEERVYASDLQKGQGSSFGLHTFWSNVPVPYNFASSYSAATPHTKERQGGKILNGSVSPKVRTEGARLRQHAKVSKCENA